MSSPGYFPLDPLPRLVAFLRLDRIHRGRSRQQTTQADRFAGVFAVAVACRRRCASGRRPPAAASCARGRGCAVRASVSSSMVARSLGSASASPSRRWSMVMVALSSRSWRCLDSRSRKKAQLRRVHVGTGGHGQQGFFAENGLCCVGHRCVSPCVSVRSYRRPTVSTLSKDLRCASGYFVTCGTGAGNRGACRPPAAGADSAPGLHSLCR
jgi:hypothetical protein